MLRPIWAFLLILLHSVALAQSSAAIERAAQRHATLSYEEFFSLLSLKNDAHIPADLEANVKWCEGAFAKRGFTSQRLMTKGLPLLLAERPAKGATKTVLIYLQIDGQPVDAKSWKQEDPWKPVWKEKDASGAWQLIPEEKLRGPIDPEWRIFARSASDAKGPVAAYLAALDAMRELKKEPNFNMKVIMDFEEELGSPNLPTAVTHYQTELKADMLIIFDGPRHISNLPTLTFGARGICEITLTVFGPRVPVHSGNYGNYTPNPALRLAELLASMKDDNGKVTLPGFYDGVILTDEEKKVLRQVPDNENEINKFLGIAEPDKVGENFQESLQYPSLNVRGLDALFIGDQVRTLIPATATAEIDIRLVPTSDPARLIELVRKHVESKGYHLVEDQPTEEERMKYPRIASFRSSISYAAFQTPFNSDCGLWLSKAMTRAFDKEPIKIRTAGGSIPISPFVTTLGIPAVAVPTVNPDNNQHAENENIRAGNYMEAVKSFLFIMLEKL